MVFSKGGKLDHGGAPCNSFSEQAARRDLGTLVQVKRNDVAEHWGREEEVKPRRHIAPIAEETSASSLAYRPERPEEQAGLCGAGGPDLPVTRVHLRSATRGIARGGDGELRRARSAGKGI